MHDATGSNFAATRSARSWSFVRLADACCTRFATAAKEFSDIKVKVWISTDPLTSLDPAFTTWPMPLDRGVLSPVRTDSSASALPATTSPSVGMRSPATTRRTSS